MASQSQDHGHKCQASLAYNVSEEQSISATSSPETAATATAALTSMTHVQSRDQISHDKPRKVSTVFMLLCTNVFLLNTLRSTLFFVSFILELSEEISWLRASWQQQQRQQQSIVGLFLQRRSQSSRGPSRNVASAPTRTRLRLAPGQPVNNVHQDEAQLGGRRAREGGPAGGQVNPLCVELLQGCHISSATHLCGVARPSPESQGHGCQPC